MIIASATLDGRETWMSESIETASPELAYVMAESVKIKKTRLHIPSNSEENRHSLFYDNEMGLL